MFRIHKQLSDLLVTAVIEQHLSQACCVLLFVSTHAETIITTLMLPG